MPLAYYSVAAGQEFWTDHWGGHSVEDLLGIARTSPLTSLITRALPPAGRVLEAGCGLGQYVLLLRERGWPVTGVDWSIEALARCRHVRPAPLAAMELTALGIRDASMAAYVSLGVVEHDPAGPDAILAEAARVLSPGGVLIASVPYLNGIRRLGRPWLVRRNAAIARRGGVFYQYAFSRREFVAALARHGFVTRTVHPYDPGRLLRRVLRRWRSAAAPAGPTPTGRPRSPAAGTPASGARAGARRLLYSAPALRLLAHMLLAVAVRR